MLVVGKAIVSQDIKDKCFLCDIASCHGECCVQGDEGAPIEKGEEKKIKSLLDRITPYMRLEGVAQVQKHGVAYTDSFGERCISLVNKQECVFVFFEQGVAKCAIEKAFEMGGSDFQKPISCHLYPLRISNYGDEFYCVNYHEWDICAPAIKKGKQEGVPLYKMLKEPLIRRFGLKWYEELLAQVEP